MFFVLPLLLGEGKFVLIDLSSGGLWVCGFNVLVLVRLMDVFCFSLSTSSLLYERGDGLCCFVGFRLLCCLRVF